MQGVARQLLANANEFRPDAAARSHRKKRAEESSTGPYLARTKPVGAEWWVAVRIWNRELAVLVLVCLQHFLAPAILQAEEPVIDAQSSRTDLRGGPGSQMRVFVERGETLGAGEVLPHPEWFTAPEAEVPDFADPSVVVWVRLHVRNASRHSLERFLEIQWPHFDRIQLFAFSPAGTALYSYETGEELPFRERPVLSRFFVFPIHLQGGEDQILILRTRASGGLHLPVVLWSAVALADKERQDLLLQGMYAGCIAVMLLYNAFLLFSVRDVSYLYYVLYVGSFFLTQSGFTGVGFQYLWPWSPWLQLRYFPVFDGLTLISFILFARTFLHTGERSPRVDRVLQVVQASGIILILLPFLFSISTANTICNVYVPLVAIAMIAISFRIWMQGFRPARFFTLAFLVLAVFIVMNQLRSLGLLPVSFFTENGTQIGSVMEVVLLSFALGDRFSALRIERERIQLLAEEKERQLSRIEKELDVARQIQGAVVEKAFPTIADLTIAVRFKPMSEVGGDFYDCHPTGDSAACFVVADVAGHGVPAALLASMAQMAFDLQRPQANNPGAVLQGMNQLLKGRMGTFFLSAECAHIDTREMRLRFASAGHPPALLFRRGLDAPMRLLPRGRLLGPFPDLALEELSIPLQAGDRLLMFSDAILEARNRFGNFFGMGRLVTYARRNEHLEAEPFAGSLLNHLLNWVSPGPLDDDFTLLVVDVKRQAGNDPVVSSRRETS